MVQIGGGKRVLLLGGEGVVIYAPRAGGVEREIALSWEMPNFDEQLVEVLQSQNAGKSVLVIFDGSDQTYRKEESIPKLSPIDRPRFVRRKLDLAFPSYPIRASFAIKPPKKKGLQLSGSSQATSYLFVALPETEQIERVSRALFESGVSVSGFGLLPLESVSLVETIARKAFAGDDHKPARWSVLIAQHETGGLRQVVVKDGALALTRLTPAGDSGTLGATWAEEVTQEFHATMKYIARLGYHSDDGLDVVIISDDVSRQFFSDSGLGVRNFTCLTPAKALKLAGFSPFGPDKDNFGDVLHAAFLSKQGRLKAPIRIPSIHSIMIPRLAVKFGYGVLAMSLLGLLYLGQAAFFTNHALGQDVEKAQVQKDMLDREYQQEAVLFEQLPVKAEMVKGVIQTKKILEANTIPVESMNKLLLKAFGGDVYVSSLEYTHTPNPALLLRGTDPSIVAAPVDEADRGSIKIVFKFALSGDLTLEQKVLRSEKLQRDLLANFPGYSVNISAQFGSVDRDGAFSASIDEAVAPSSADELAEITMEGKPL